MLDNLDFDSIPGGLKISPDGTRVARLSLTTLSLWNIANGACLFQRKRLPNTFPNSFPNSFPADPFSETDRLIHFTPDSKTVIFFEQAGGEFLALDARSGTPKVTWKRIPKSFNLGSFSQDHRLVAPTTDDEFCIWDTRSGELLTKLPDPQKNNNKLLALWRVLSLSEDVPDADESIPVNPFFSVSFFSIGNATFSQDGNQIVGVWDGELAVWKRQRPEYWWGIAWLWEFWATAIFGVALIWSLCRKTSKRSKQIVSLEIQKAAT